MSFFLDSFCVDDILRFIAVLFCRGLFCRGVSVRSLWNKKYALPIVQSLSSRNNFLRIMRCLRFDDKNTRETRRSTDTFCMARKLWERFIENSQACYKTNIHLTVDEQLLPSKTRFMHTQYIPTKPGKYGIIF